MLWRRTAVSRSHADTFSQSLHEKYNKWGKEGF